MIVTATKYSSAGSVDALGATPSSGSGAIAAAAVEAFGLDLL
jgi:hypothetical protein